MIKDFYIFIIGFYFLTKTKFVMETTKVNELFEALKANWNEFETNHAIFSAKENKAAGSRARKSIQALKKLVTEYKKASIEATKAK